MATSSSSNRSNSVSQSSIIELNVGGVCYTTSFKTLTSEPSSRLGKMFGGNDHCTNKSATTVQINDQVEQSEQISNNDYSILKDSKGKCFLDRDGVLFRYTLDFLRNKKLVLPDNFTEMKRLLVEAEYFELTSMVDALRVSMSSNSIQPPNQIMQQKMEMKQTEAAEKPHLPLTSSTSASSVGGLTTPTSSRPSATDMSGLPGTAGAIVVGYRGTFAFGRDGMADVCFRKLTRILVHGKVNLCREVFGDTLNESRDPDRGGQDRYSSRFFLKHTSLEQAFDMLLDQGFILAGCSGTGTSTSASELKPGVDSEELRWNHYNEFVWLRK